MSDKNSKNSSEKIYDDKIMIISKNNGKTEELFKSLLDEITKNKDILLQVRIDEQYDKKINFLENILERNRSEVVRLAIDNLFDSYLLKENKPNKKMEIKKLEQETIYLLKYILDIYDSNNINEYIKALKKNLVILEEESKKKEE